MPETRYRVLRIVFGFFSLAFAIGGVLMIFSSKSLIVRVFMHPPESEVSTLLLFVLKEMGGLVLMLGVMLFLASRDPQRNVAIIDAVRLIVSAPANTRISAHQPFQHPAPVCELHGLLLQTLKDLTTFYGRVYRSWS